MDYAVEFSSLPSALRQELSPFYDRQDHGSVADGIAEYLNSGGSPTPELIVALACATFLHALEVVVDDIIPASEKALALLDEPIVETAIPRVAGLKLEMERVLGLSILDSVAESSKADGAIGGGTTTVDQLVSSAHSNWERERYEEAAGLFLRAAEQESKEAAERHRHAAPDRSMSYLVRAGQCLYKAGRISEALPLLRRAAAFDWKKARLWNDRHTSEWAFVSMLEERALSNDWTGFAELWREAVRRSEELQMKFPFIHPHQERLLEICHESGQFSYLPTIIHRIEKRESRIPKKLQQRISEVKESAARAGH